MTNSKHCCYFCFFTESVNRHSACRFCPRWNRLGCIRRKPEGTFLFHPVNGILGTRHIKKKITRSSFSKCFYPVKIIINLKFPFLAYTYMSKYAQISHQIIKILQSRKSDVFENGHIGTFKMRNNHVFVCLLPSNTAESVVDTDSVSRVP